MARKRGWRSEWKRCGCVMWRAKCEGRAKGKGEDESVCIWLYTTRRLLYTLGIVLTLFWTEQHTVNARRMSLTRTGAMTA